MNSRPLLWSNDGFIPPMKFLTAKVYYQSLLEAIPAAKKRIVIHAMSVLWGGSTEHVAHLLLDAAARGVEVHVVGDIYSKLESRLPRFRRTAVPSWRHTLKINRQLRAGGVHVAFIGKLRANPYKNRCHTKVTIIDDVVYTFGGTNFTPASFDNHDYMFEIHSPELADHLYRLVGEIEKDPLILPNQTLPLDSAHTLLFDGGTPGSSVIYDTACKVVAAAKKVYYVSQMCPSGRLATHITATDNECYFIRPSQSEPPASFDLIWNKFRYRIVNRYTGKRYIHAKFILTEDHDGSKHVISGSHNFSWRGVTYGTKEIAVHATDPVLWGQLYDFMRLEVGEQAAT